MPFESIGDKNLDAVVNVRLTTEEKAQLKAASDVAAISMSALIRARYFGRKVTSNSDAVVLNELRRIGGLLKHIRNENRGTYSQNMIDVIESVQTYMKLLSESIEKK